MAPVFQFFSTFTIRDWLTALAIVVSLFSFFGFYIPKRERFINGKKLSWQELELVEQGGAEFDSLDSDKQKVLRQGYGLLKDYERLKAKQWGNIYQKSLERLLGFFAWAARERKPVFAGNKSMSKVVFTENSFVLCLSLAFVYPLLFAIVGWLMADQGLVIGSHVFLANISMGYKWLFFIALIVIGVGAYWLIKIKGLLGIAIYLATSVIFLFVSVYTDAMSLVIFASVTLAFNCVGFGVGSKTNLGPIILVLAFVVSLGFASLWSIHVTLSLVLILILVVIGIAALTHINTVLDLIEHLYETKELWLITYFLALIYMITCLGLTLYFGEQNKIEALLVPLFLGLFPLLNAIIDWASLNITRWLLHKLHHDIRWWQAVLWAIFDVFAAIIFVFTITGLLVSVLAGVNWMGHEYANGREALDFGSIMRDVKDPGKAGEMIWAHGMVLSTIIPTLLHFGFVIWALHLRPLMWWSSQKVIDNFWRDDRARIRLLRYDTFSNWLLWMLGLLFIAAVFYLELSTIYRVITLDGLLWDWANLILLAIDPSYVTPVVDDPCFSDACGIGVL